MRLGIFVADPCPGRMRRGLGTTFDAIGGRWYDPRMEKTTIYLPSELQERLRRAARREGRSQADLVREAIHERLARNGEHVPSIVGMFDETSKVTSTDVKTRIREELAERRSRR